MHSIQTINMPYTKSLEEIIDYLASCPGIVIHHKERGALKVLSVSKEEKTARILAADKETGEFVDNGKGWDLAILFGDKELIESDGVFIFKTPEEKPQLNVGPLPNASSKQPLGSKELLNEESQKKKEIGVFDAEAEFSKHHPSPMGVFYKRYRDLFDDMDFACDGDYSMKGLSKHFWHYCAFDTALAVVNSGSFLSRAAIAERGIRNPFDNMINNPGTHAVMDKNRSHRVEEYCRFFLRPRNGPSYNLVNTMREKDVSPVLFAINRSALWNKAQRPTLLIYGCAGAYYDEAFDWNKHNLKTMALLQKRDFSHFEWDMIYAFYSKSASDEIKFAQKSEFLIHEELPIEYIDAIFFDNSTAMKSFQNLIRRNHPELVDKCNVDSELLWGIHK